MSFRSASVGGHRQRLFQPRQLFFGFANRQLADVQLQLEIGELFVELLRVEFDERLAGVDFGAVLDDLDDFKLRPGFGPQGDGRHLLGREGAVERDDDFQPLGFGLGGLAFLFLFCRLLGFSFLLVGFGLALGLWFRLGLSASLVVGLRLCRPASPSSLSYRPDFVVGGLRLGRLRRQRAWVRLRSSGRRRRLAK